MKRYDAIIAGGGPAGASAGLLLARAGWSVAILEKAAFPRPKVCGELISGNVLPFLEQLGVAEAFALSAGPPVNEVSICRGNDSVISAMPVPAERAEAFGRALARERFDALLLDAAERAGAHVRERTTLASMGGRPGRFAFETRGHGRESGRVFYAPLFIAAHGSWQPGSLPTQARRRVKLASDLFAFKAHFREARVPAGRIVILPFPGGYAGLVRIRDDLTTVACCIRRDALAALRRRFAEPRAAEAVLRSMVQACPAAQQMLGAAKREGSWLSAGPLLPGVRLPMRAGIFATGNAVGEAHPIIGEGISMALQGSRLLAELLIAEGDALFARRDSLNNVATAYQAAWRSSFTPRLRAAALFAQIAMRPAAAALAMTLLRRLPGLLPAAALVSGKTRLSPPAFLTGTGRPRPTVERASR